MLDLTVLSGRQSSRCQDFLDAIIVYQDLAFEELAVDTDSNTAVYQAVLHYREIMDFSPTLTVDATTYFRNHDEYRILRDYVMNEITAGFTIICIPVRSDTKQSDRDQPLKPAKADVPKDDLDRSSASSSNVG